MGVVVSSLEIDGDDDTLVDKRQHTNVRHFFVLVFFFLLLEKRKTNRFVRRENTRKKKNRDGKDMKT